MKIKMNLYLLTICVVLCVFSGCSKKEALEENSRFIRAQKVQFSSAEKTRTFSGVAKATVESKLSFRVSGTIDELVIKVGDHVKKGQLLAKIDETDYRLNMEELKARYQLAKANLDRVRSLYETQNTSKEDLDNSQSSLNSLKAQLELSDKQLSYTRLLAPSNGAIVSVDVEVHERVNPGEVVCVHESEEGIEVSVGIPESLIDQIKASRNVELHFESITSDLFAGTVVEIGGKIDKTTGTFPVTVKIDRDDPRIKSGMVCEVQFVFGDGDVKKIFIPLAAVFEDANNKTFVWVFNKDKQAVYKREIQVGSIRNTSIAVNSGLMKDEIIATAGAHYLSEGRKVKIKEQEL